MACLRFTLRAMATPGVEQNKPIWTLRRKIHFNFNGYTRGTSSPWIEDKIWWPKLVPLLNLASLFPAKFSNRSRLKFVCWGGGVCHHERTNKNLDDVIHNQSNDKLPLICRQFLKQTCYSSLKSSLKCYYCIITFSQVIFLYISKKHPIDNKMKICKKSSNLRKNYTLEWFQFSGFKEQNLRGLHYFIYWPEITSLEF